MTDHLNHSKRLFNKNNKYGEVELIFNQYAMSYLSQPHLILRETAQRMHERLDYIKLVPNNLLDAGCGVGYDIKRLQQKYIHASAFGIDVSMSMLKMAFNLLSVSQRFLSFKTWFRLRTKFNVNLIQNSFDALPFSCDYFDLIWSNLALHWHANPRAVISEWHRVLKQDAMLMFSAFGPDTFIELHDLFIKYKDELALENKWLEPIIEFIDMHNYGDMLVASGFNNVVMDRDAITIVYKDVDTCINDIELLGIYRKLDAFNNVSKNPYKALKIALNKQLNNCPNGLKLTFEIVYGHAFKGKNKEQKLLEKSKVRVEDIGGRKRLN